MSEGIVIDEDIYVLDKDKAFPFEIDADEDSFKILRDFIAITKNAKEPEESGRKENGI